MGECGPLRTSDQVLAPGPALGWSLSPWLWRRFGWRRGYSASSNERGFNRVGELLPAARFGLGDAEVGEPRPVVLWRSHDATARVTGCNSGLSGFGLIDSPPFARSPVSRISRQQPAHRTLPP